MQDSRQDTVASQWLRKAAELGVDNIFVNLGSDHPAFMNAFAEASKDGSMPRVIVCPHEMTALSAAHGHAMTSGKLQMVLVHVDVGTQNLGGSIHDATRGRAPVIVVAGMSPVTGEPGVLGGRTEFIHYLQDVPAQADIVRQYMKWTYELRRPESAEAVLNRACIVATSEPKGPVYIQAAREIWEAPAYTSPTAGARAPTPVTPGTLSAEDSRWLLEAIAQAKHPVVLTSYLGRNPATVPAFVQFVERTGLAVVDTNARCVNMPGNHPHFLGYSRSAIPPEADLVLVIDCDVPWLPQIGRPRPDALVVGIDIDPLKSTIGLWDFVYDRALQADTAAAIPALNRALETYLVERGQDELDGTDARRRWIHSLRERQAQTAPKRGPGEDRVRAVLAELRRQAPEKHIVVCEAPSHTEVMPDALRMERPGSLHHSGGSGLGWGINAALGAKLANPDHLVTAIVGDGCFMFGVPTSCYWVSRQYELPFLTVLLNNGGWRSPSISTNLVHEDGPAKASNRYHINAGRGVRFDGVAAAAGDAATFTIDTDDGIESIMKQAIQEVQNGRSALVMVNLPLVSDD